MVTKTKWQVRKIDGRWWIIMPGGRYGSAYGSFAELQRTWKYDYRLPVTDQDYQRLT